MAVLALSAGAKLRDRAALPSALAMFGVPSSLTRPATVLLPATELTVAALAAIPGFDLGVWIAVVLLGVLTVSVTANLAAGRRPPCPCFGVVSARPISGVTLVRNAVLLAVAILATG